MTDSHPVFVPLLKQPNLPHQIDLIWVRRRQMVMAVCACARWEGVPYSPTDSETRFPMALAEYQMHVAVAKLDEAEQGLAAALGG